LKNFFGGPCVTALLSPPLDIIYYSTFSAESNRQNTQNVMSLLKFFAYFDGRPGDTIFSYFLFSIIILPKNFKKIKYESFELCARAA